MFLPPLLRLPGTLTLALLLLGSPTLSSAQTFIAFGPVQYSRDTGKPTAVSKTFNVLDLSATFTMRIDSGGVSSAIVTLNGVDVFKESDFNQTVKVLTKAVTLLATNQLTVELRGKPGESFALQIIGNVGITPGQTQLSAAHVVPPSITPNTQFTLTVLIGIPDPNVIPDSVNLVRILGTGTRVILGQLHDDGTNGDALAGDTLYTIQLPVKEPTVGEILLQVSAVFQGQLGVAVSPLLKVPVTSDANLPPDPGSAGMITLAGIDSDGDGVRDDLQRYVALTYPDSAKTRAALTDMIKAMQMLVVDSGDAQKSAADAIAFSNALECSIAIHGLPAAMDLASNLRAQVLNTVSRSQAYIAADAHFGGHTYTLASTTGQGKALCTFNPDLLPN